MSSAYVVTYGSHGTTDIKPEMLSGVQTRNRTLHDRYDKRGIAHVRTNRKDNIFMQRRLGQIFICILEWGKGLVKNQDGSLPERTQP